jgi:hypothetical protein
MQFNICTNLDNGVGLEADYKILKGLLESWGHRVNGIHYKKVDGGTPRADVNIFLEVIAPPVFAASKNNWFIPNQEWYCNSYDAMLPRMTRILCKTHDAYMIFRNKLVGLAGDKVSYIGFESYNKFAPEVPRLRKFLHVMGKSTFKNTEAVAYTFAKYFDTPWEPENNRELVVVGTHENLLTAARDHKNVRYIPHISDSGLRQLMNECRFHILPSSAEGWGHAIHEGLSCGAVMITTDFPPMNEFKGASIFVKHQIVKPCCAGKRAMVVAPDIKAAVEKAWAMNDGEILNASANAIRYFADQRDRFRTAFKWEVDNVRT